MKLIYLLAFLPFSIIAQEYHPNSMAGINKNEYKGNYVFNPSQDPKSIERVYSDEKMTSYNQGWTAPSCYPNNCPLRHDIYAAAIDDFKATHNLEPKTRVVIDSWVCGNSPDASYTKTPCTPLQSIGIGKVCLQDDANLYCNPEWNAHVYYLGTIPNHLSLNENLKLSRNLGCNFSGPINDRIFIEQSLIKGVCYTTYRNVTTNFKIVDIGGKRIEFSDYSVILNSTTNPFVIKKLEHDQDRSCMFENVDKNLYLEHVWLPTIHSYLLDVEYIERRSIPSCP